jgi:glycosyltransferase involved in cell wall biosynthesis
MRLLYIADGRSPIAINWIKYFIESGHEVHLVSTHKCDPELPLASLNIIHVGVDGFIGKVGENSVNNQRGDIIRRVLPVELRTAIRQRLSPTTLRRSSHRLIEIIELIQPSLIHAMRIPFEGMIAALSLRERKEFPLIISIWGNDFTLHAKATKKMGLYTRTAMHRANCVHVDCYRDQQLAYKWGFDQTKSSVVLPGGGGVQVDIFYPSTDRNLDKGKDEQIIIVNPRGFRAYVRNDTFFQAIPLVLEHRPDIKFICPAMIEESQAQNWIKKYKIEDSVELLPKISRHQMADVFRESKITVSITDHDGTPNTLLEAMACGSFPIVGDIESLREWIVNEENGLLVDPYDHRGLAAAILQAIREKVLLTKAQDKNIELIKTRAEYSWVMSQAEKLYTSLVE